MATNIFWTFFAWGKDLFWRAEPSITVLYYKMKNSQEKRVGQFAKRVEQTAESLGKAIFRDEQSFVESEEVVESSA